MNLRDHPVYYYFLKKFEIVESSRGWFRFYSPFTEGNSRSMAVNFECNRVICHRTHYKSSISTFIKRVENINVSDISEIVKDLHKIQPINRDIIAIDKVKLPDHFYLIDEDVALSERARKYLVNTRNLDLDLLIDRSIGFCNKDEWCGFIVFPFLNPELVYYQGRNFLGSNRRHKNVDYDIVGIGKSELFYNESALNKRYAILVEGIIDALTCGDAGFASLGWHLSDIQKSKIINSNLEELFIIPDKGFYKKAALLACSFIEYMSVYVCDNMDYLEGKDVNENGIDALNFKRINKLSDAI